MLQPTEENRHLMLINDGNPRQWTIWRIWEKKYLGLVERGHMSYLLCILMRMCTRLCMNTSMVCVLGGLCASAREIEERRACGFEYVNLLDISCRFRWLRCWRRIVVDGETKIKYVVSWCCRFKEKGKIELWFGFWVWGWLNEWEECGLSNLTWILSEECFLCWRRC
jgi:hypothetical protein